MVVRVAVLLDPEPGDLGGWLADARAFEAAGADALWVDPAAESGLDPLALVAALAALTSKALLVAAVPAAERPAESLARTLATIGLLARNRVALAADPARLDQLAAVAPGFEAFRRLPGEPEAFERRPDGPVERWVRTPSPEGRSAWRADIAEAAATGAAGVLVPAGPRLLDILRNPDDPGGRHDLHLAQG